MASQFKKDSLKFDRFNYDNCEERMMTYLLCISLGYQLVTKNKKNVIKEDNLEGCDEKEKDMFILNIIL